jgi:outer membrane protein OmpA-like peptidoglycan-associated protein
MKLHVLPLTLLLGCATVPPPKELVAARSSFERAEKGIAAKLAPAALDSAKQALQKAERAFRDTSDSPETRALGYIADRRARQAETEGELQEAEGNKVAAQKEFAERSAEELDRARTAIKSEKQKAEEERLRAENERKAREEADRARAEAERGRKEAERVAAAALASLKEMAQVKEEQRGVVITLSGAVLFASGKSDLLSIAKEKLTEVYKVLKDQGHPKLRIEGHTDSVGSAEENRRLSLARAESVKAHLVSLGYPADRITVAGLGPDNPVADNGSAEGRANNRRVEIIVNPTR